MEPIFSSAAFYCAVLVLFGIVSLAVIWRFARSILVKNPDVISDDQLDKLIEFYKASNNSKTNPLWHMVNANAEHLQRRNEFWASFVQIAAALLIVIVLGVLLLTRTISAEAGLPILSAVSGFVIAKSANSNRGAGDSGSQQ